jgi:hypothetical protein
VLRRQARRWPALPVIDAAELADGLRAALLFGATLLSCWWVASTAADSHAPRGGGWPAPVPPSA